MTPRDKALASLSNKQTKKNQVTYNGNYDYKVIKRLLMNILGATAYIQAYVHTRAK